MDQPDVDPYQPQSPPPPTPVTPSDAVDKLGFHAGLGPLPHGGQSFLAGVLGLGIEHQLVGHWRILGEYEWLWLDGRSSSMTSELFGTGHRAHLGLRRRLVSSPRLGKRFDFFVDAELGGGLAIASLPDAVDVIPHGFAGLRLGYDLLAKDPTPSSRVFEVELGLRLVGSRDGLGGTFGVGLLWGD